MKILAIGASGMLARPVVEHLDKLGFEIRLFSRSVDKTMFLKDHEIVNGDVFNPVDLEKAVVGCSAIHINLSNVDEFKATLNIVAAAEKHNIKLISMISGNSTSEENRWFPMIDNKFKAEQVLIESKIPYLIFRCTWFFESLELMVRNGKASVIGKQSNPSHWIAAKDYARMVGEAYNKPGAKNRIFYIMGPKPYVMKESLEKYCAVHHPDIKKVSTVPVGMLKFIAFLSRNNELKQVAEMFGYFEKTKELGNPEETNALLGKPEIDFDKWLTIKE